MSKTVTKKLLVTSMGDEVYRYQKSIVVFFNGNRKVLSTSIFNGGYHENFTAVYNNDCTQGSGMPCLMLGNTYWEHMKLRSKVLGLQWETVTGMCTAAQMENAAIVSDAYKELSVTAIVTGGIETNGGRVGDPSDYYRPEPKKEKPGTINIILLIDCDMPAGTLTRALVTCTEAKTTAIQELLAGSNYSTGLATGSGTDQTIIVANSDSQLYLEGAGKHSKLGELIGQTVKKAVKEALAKQSGLDPTIQHDVLRRIKRYNCTEDDLWQWYEEKYSDHELLLKPVFLDRLSKTAKNSMMVSLVSLYVHLLDQYSWNLLSEAEIVASGNILLQHMAKEFQITVNTNDLLRNRESFIPKFKELLVKVVVTNI